jgi:hypothetical protein
VGKEKSSSYRKQTYGFQKSHTSSNTKAMPRIMPERFQVLSEKCPNCGK